MRERTAALALMVTLAVAPAAAQGPRPDRDILPPDVVRDLERVIEEAAIVATRSVRQSLRSVDLDRELRRELERELGRRSPLEATSNPAAQDRGRDERTGRTVRTIALGANGLLELKNVAGDITVNVGGRTNVEIEIVKRSRANTASAAEQGLEEVPVTIDHRGERVVVDTTYPRNRAPYQVTTTYNVTAPPGTRVNARSVSGNVTVRGITGDVSIETVSGMVRVNDGARVSQARSVSGEVQLADLKTDGIVAAGSVSGNVILQRIRARQVTAETVSGRVNAADVTSDGVQLKSLSGPVEFLGSLSRNGRYELNSHSGTVRLVISGGVGFELQARSFSGRIRPEGLSLQSISMNRGALRATVGDASAVVIAGTFSGDVVVGRK